MCGIVGITSNKEVTTRIINSLKKLEKLKAEKIQIIKQKKLVTDNEKQLRKNEEIRKKELKNNKRLKNFNNKLYNPKYMDNQNKG